MRFFEEVAKAERFDPLVDTNWYINSLATLLSHQDGYGIWSYYEKDFVKALVDTFPNIGLDKFRFRRPLWKSWADPDNRKWFFVEFARRQAYDPLIADNWYLLDPNALTSMGVDKILRYHDGSVTKALLDLFPDIGLEEHKFTALPSDYWKRKKVSDFFENFAKRRGFDALTPGNWYSFILKDFLSEKGASAVLEEYNSFSNALAYAFPDIGLDPSNFSKSPRHYWKDKENRKSFFLHFARSNSIDPLVAEGWYKLPAGKISSAKGGSAVLDYHGGSLSKALQDLFPHLRIDESKFLFLPRNYWKEKHKRRAFFESFAVEHKFDALVPENWYSLRPSHVTTYKGVKGLLANYYNGSLAKALIDLFPDVALDESKFESFQANSGRT